MPPSARLRGSIPAMTRSGLAAVVIVLSSSIAAVANADAISPPPTGCPPWSEPVMCHGAPTCQLSECTSDADCGPAEGCQMLDVCNNLNNCGGMAGRPL